MNKIPKKIHYCWFGRGEKSKLAKKCIKSWKKFLCNYEIMEWNEDNFDINSNKFVKQAYDNKKYAFVSDYVRLYALLNHGGIYMDTDVEVLKSLDPLLDNEAFIGFESEILCGTAIIGAKKENKIIKSFFNSYENRSFIKEDGTYNDEPNTEMATNICCEYGLKLNNTIQNLKHITVYPKTFFSPLGYEESEYNFSEDTYVIHHFDGRWMSDEKKFESMQRRKINRKKNLLKRYLGYKKANFILDFNSNIRYKLGSIYRIGEFYIKKYFKKDIINLEIPKVYDYIYSIYNKPNQSNVPKSRSRLKVIENTKNYVDVSVIIPAYNVENYIEECIESILNQVTEYTFEIIVVDDGSTDKTLEIIQKYRNNIHIISQKNQGVSHARNIAIDNSKGKYIMFVDSDDYVEKNAIDVLVKKAKKENADIVIGRYRTIHKYIKKESNKFSTEYFSGDNTINLPGIPWARIFKKSIFDDIRFPEGYWFEDTIINGLIYRIAENIICINDVIYNYRLNESGITGSAKKSIKSLDTYFITEYILEYQKELNLINDKKLYYFLLYHLSIITYNRLKGFDEEICKKIFVLSSNIISNIRPLNLDKTTFPKGLKYIEESFLNRDYSLFKNTIKMINTGRFNVI